MQSWQLQGAACCGITRGLHRECRGGAHDVAFSLKMTPSDFCVNEVSISGVVADVFATPPPNESEALDTSQQLDNGLQSVIDCSNDDMQPSAAASHTASSAAASTIDMSLSAPSESGFDTLRACFADYTEWSRAHADLSAIACTFFSNPKPHSLFAPQLLLLSDAALNDKLLRKRAYNFVRTLFPFVSLTTPSPPG
jgi:hypothetical protein